MRLFWVVDGEVPPGEMIAKWHIPVTAWLPWALSYSVLYPIPTFFHISVLVVSTVLFLSSLLLFLGCVIWA